MDFLVITALSTKVTVRKCIVSVVGRVHRVQFIPHRVMHLTIERVAY